MKNIPLLPEIPFVFMENGIPQPESNISTISITLEEKTYSEEKLKNDITDNLEQEVIDKLILVSDRVEGKQEELEYLLAKGDMEIYNVTKKFISNRLIINPKNKDKVNINYPYKEIIYTDLIPENKYLMIVYSDDKMTFPAVLIKSNNKYLLDVLNIDLMKVVILK